jgi:hypothetical protein
MEGLKPSIRCCRLFNFNYLLGTVEKDKRLRNVKTIKYFLYHHPLKPEKRENKNFLQKNGGSSAFGAIF